MPSTPRSTTDSSCWLIPIIRIRTNPRPSWASEFRLSTISSRRQGITGRDRPKKFDIVHADAADHRGVAVEVIAHDLINDRDGVDPTGDQFAEDAFLGRRLVDVERLWGLPFDELDHLRFRDRPLAELPDLADRQILVG